MSEQITEIFNEKMIKQRAKDIFIKTLNNIKETLEKDWPRTNSIIKTTSSNFIENLYSQVLNILTETLWEDKFDLTKLENLYRNKKTNPQILDAILEDIYNHKNEFKELNNLEILQIILFLKWKKIKFDKNYNLSFFLDQLDLYNQKNKPFFDELIWKNKYTMLRKLIMELFQNWEKNSKQIHTENWNVSIWNFIWELKIQKNKVQINTYNPIKENTTTKKIKKNIEKVNNTSYLNLKEKNLENTKLDEQSNGWIWFTTILEKVYAISFSKILEKYLYIKNKKIDDNLYNKLEEFFIITGNNNNWENFNIRNLKYSNFIKTNKKWEIKPISLKKFLENNNLDIKFKEEYFPLKFKEFKENWDTWVKISVKIPFDN